jgi:hypothetical protein
MPAPGAGRGSICSDLTLVATNSRFPGSSVGTGIGEVIRLASLRMIFFAFR